MLYVPLTVTALFCCVSCPGSAGAALKVLGNDSNKNGKQAKSAKSIHRVCGRYSNVHCICIKNVCVCVCVGGGGGGGEGGTKPQRLGLLSASNSKKHRHQVIMSSKCYRLGCHD